jgi:hypothetical protein
MIVTLDSCFIQARTVAMMTTLVASAALFVFPFLVGMKVEFLSFAPFLIFAGILAIFLPYLNWRRMYRLRAALETGILTLLFSVPVLVLTYCAMRLGLPLADDWLAAMDARIGVHTPGIVLWVDRFPRLAWMLGQAYGSFAPQLLMLPPLLALSGRSDRAYRFAICYFILCAISSLVTIAFPSLGSFSHYGLTQAELNNVSAHFGYAFFESFSAVRNDPAFTLSLGVASGIVTFPSVHAGVAVLCAWGAWTIPLLRWPILALNIAMFASAITHGSHYFVDLLAGGLIAVMTIMLVNWLTSMRTEATRSAALSGRDVPAGAGAARSA